MERDVAQHSFGEGAAISGRNSQNGVPINSAPSRREVLTILGALGAATLLPGSELFGQVVNKSAAKGGRIDVHHHHRLPTTNAPWTPEQSLEAMDKFDIATSILSLTGLANLLYEGTPKGRAAARSGNDYGAKIVSDHPKRFGLFASVPLPDTEGTLKEIEYAYDTLKCDGISVYTNDDHNRWPGDSFFEPMWKELDRRNAIVYMHPSVGPCCRDLNVGVSQLVNEIDFDTARACTSLLVNGVLHNYPNVRIIIPHSGGTMPVLAGRIDFFIANVDRYKAAPKHPEYFPNGAYSELQKFYFDIAHASFPTPLGALLNFAPTTHILFGTDYPPVSMETTVNELPKSKLSPKLLRAIDRENAEHLFPRLKV
jgi:predicted TIM-barrel fold metal-dependent hydrolase